MGSVRWVYGCFRLPISGLPFSLNLQSRSGSLGCSLRCVHQASDCLLYSCQSRGNGEAGDWKANGTGEIAAEAKVLVRVETARNPPPRTTGCVPGNEQCVCHRAAKTVEVFDARGVSFVAVTQPVQHDDIDGTLDAQRPAVLRPVRARGDRQTDRDKIAASKQKGMWMGGLVPLGYDVIDRCLERSINRRRRRSWKSSAVTWNSGPSGS